MALPLTGILGLVDYIQQLRNMRNTANSYTEADDAKRIAEMQASMNTPEYMNRFENNLRDMEYGTVAPVDFQYVGPQTEDSVTFQLGEAMLPRRLDSIPVESNFTPAQLEALRDRIYGTQEQVGPQREEPFVMPGPGGDFMPRGNEKSAFDTSFEDVEYYLRGGVVGRRRA